MRECYTRLFAGESIQTVTRDLNTRGVGGEVGALSAQGKLVESRHAGPLPVPGVAGRVVDPQRGRDG